MPIDYNESSAANKSKDKAKNIVVGGWPGPGISSFHKLNKEIMRAEASSILNALLKLDKQYDLSSLFNSQQVYHGEIIKYSLETIGSVKALRYWNASDYQRKHVCVIT